MLVSFIIPIYNAEKYLSVCIESLLGQNVYDEDLEIILVDDGSTDDSGKLCDKLADKWRNICVFHRKNFGVSVSRNFGIQQAKGDYICFVDADDYVLPNSLYDVYRKVETEDADYYVFPFQKEVKPGKIETQRYSLEGKTYEVNDAYEPFFKDGKNGPWSKVFKKKIITDYGVSFDEKLKIHEDVMFCMDYLQHCKSVCYPDKAFYFYRWNENGAIRMHKLEYLDNYSIVYQKWAAFLLEHELGKNIKTLNSQFLHKMVTTSGKLLKHGMDKKTINARLDENKLYHILMQTEYDTLQDKLLYCILKFRWFEIVALKVK